MIDSEAGRTEREADEVAKLLRSTHDVVLGCFIRYGLAATWDQLREATGLSAARLCWHFASPRELLLEVADMWFRKLEGMLRVLAGEPFAGPLERIDAMVFAHLCATPEVLLVVREAGRTEPRARTLIAGHLGVLATLYEGPVAALTGGGQALSVAILLVGVIVGLVVAAPGTDVDANVGAGLVTNCLEALTLRAAVESRPGAQHPAARDCGALRRREAPEMGARFP